MPNFLFSLLINSYFLHLDDNIEFPIATQSILAIAFPISENILTKLLLFIKGKDLSSSFTKFFYVLLFLLYFLS